MRMKVAHHLRGYLAASLFTLLCLSTVLGEENRCGMFDVSLVLDRSSSITADDWKRLVSFTQNVTSQFSSPLNRYSIYTFSQGCKIELNYTNNVTEITRVAQGLTRPSDTGTNPGSCLRLANAALDARQVKHVPIYIIVTDGEENVDNGAGEAQCNEARLRGATVFVVHVGKVTDPATKVNQAMANKPTSEFLIDIQNYAELATRDFIKKLVTRAEGNCLTTRCVDGMSIAELTVTNATGANPVCAVYPSSALSTGTNGLTPIESFAATRVTGTDKFYCQLRVGFPTGKYALSFVVGQEQKLLALATVEACSTADAATCLNGAPAVLVRMSGAHTALSPQCKLYPVAVLSGSDTELVSVVEQVAPVALGDSVFRCEFSARIPAGKYALIFTVAGSERLRSEISFAGCATGALECRGGASVLSFTVGANAAIASGTCSVYAVSAYNATSPLPTPVAGANLIVGGGSYVCNLPGSLPAGVYTMTLDAPVAASSTAVRRMTAVFTVVACATVEAVCSAGRSSLEVTLQSLSAGGIATCQLMKDAAGTAITAAFPATERSVGKYSCVVPDTVVPGAYFVSFVASGLSRGVLPVQISACAVSKALCVNGWTTTEMTLQRDTVISSGHCVVFRVGDTRPLRNVPALPMARAGKYRCTLPTDLEPMSYSVTFEADGVTRSVTDTRVAPCASAQPSCLGNGSAVATVVLPQASGALTAECVLYEKSVLESGTDGKTPLLRIVAEKLPQTDASEKWRCVLGSALLYREFAIGFATSAGTVESGLSADGAISSVAFLSLLPCASATAICSGHINMMNVTMAEESDMTVAHCLVFSPNVTMNTVGQSTPILIQPAVKYGAGLWQCELDLPSNEYAVAIEAGLHLRAYTRVVLPGCGMASSESAFPWKYLLFLLALLPFLLLCLYSRRRKRDPSWSSPFMGKGTELKNPDSPKFTSTAPMHSPAPSATMSTGGPSHVRAPPSGGVPLPTTNVPTVSV